VEALIEPFRDRIRLSTPVRAVLRDEQGVTVAPYGWPPERFDRVVLATHADQALELLTDADDLEQAVLGTFGYSSNVAWLHGDESVLPTLERGRASWNYRLEGCTTFTDRSRVSYWMNRLQGHPDSDPLIVTLNPADRDAPADPVARMTYLHPTYTAESVAAQDLLPSLSSDRLAFAGAYHGWGFHEDGCRSGVAAAAALGATW
jgi:predicted NAD/FAD-binding protein